MQNAAEFVPTDRPAPGHEIVFAPYASARVPGARWACTCGAYSRAKTTKALRAARERHDDRARAPFRNY